MAMRKMRHAAVLVAVLLSGALLGCGGGKSPAAATRGTGTMTMRVVWPEAPTKMIPTVAQSIRFDLSLPGQGIVLLTTLVARPNTVATLTGVPAGSVQVKATAYPTLGGTGTPVASHQQIYDVLAGATTSGSITLDSAISSFAITPVTTQTPLPASWSMAVGGTVQLSAAAFDASGNGLMIPAVNWSVFSGVAFVSLTNPRQTVAAQTATITGLTAGTAVIQATFSEAPGFSRTAQYTVTVTPPARKGANFRLGSTGEDVGSDVARDASGNVVLAGTFQGTVDFDPGTGVSTRTALGSVANPAAYDVFLAKYNDQNALLWVLSFGGPLSETVRGLTVDSAGYIYITGSYESRVDFNPLGVPAIATGAQEKNTYIAKYSPAGRLLWLRTFARPSAPAPLATDFDEGLDLAVDTAGNVFACGQFSGTVNFDSSGVSGIGNTFTAPAGAKNLWYASFDPTGAFRFAQTLGGLVDDAATGIRVGSDGSLFVAGYYSGSVNFDPTAVATPQTAVGGRDAFVAKYDGTTHALQWVTAFGGLLDDQVEPGALALNAQNQPIVGGSFSGSLSIGANRLTSNGGVDAFMVMLDQAGAVRAASNIGGVGDDHIRKLRLDSAGAMYICGDFQTSMALDPAAIKLPVTSATTVPGSDAFLAAYTADGKLNWQWSFGGKPVGAGIQMPTQANSLTIDNKGNVTATGRFSYTGDLDPGTTVLPVVSLGLGDAFVVTLDSSGNVLR